MSDTKTHLGQAIDIIKSFFNPYFEIYSDVVQQLFDSYRIPKLDPSLCSVDDFIKAALDGKTLRIKSIFNNVFDYQNDLTLSDNIKNWGICIKQFRFNDSSELMRWSDISDEELRKELVQSLINEINKQNINIRPFSSFLTKKEIDFYYNIIKSLLNAEYLFIEDYSKQLEDTIKNIEATETTFYIKKPRFVRDFLILAPKMTEMCGRIRNAIGERNNRRIEIEDFTEENVNRIMLNFNIDDNPTANTDDLFLFTQSVIEMTCIDHIYKVSSNNIGKLLILWRRIKNLNEIEYDNFYTVVNMVKAKTASLIFKMVFENGDKKSHQYLDIDYFDFFFKDSKNIEKDTQNYVLPKNLNKTISYKIRKKDKTIKKDELNTANKKLDLSTCQNIQDILMYNSWVEKGQEYYVQMSYTIATIENYSQIDDIDDVINCIYDFINIVKQSGDNIGCFSPFFFISAIHFVNNQLKINEENIDNMNRLLDLMNKLLLYLERYIRTYINSMPPVFRPYFEHSFYQYDENKYSFKYFVLDTDMINNYNCDNFNNSFFFASYYCNAININRLHDFYESSFLQFQSYSPRLTQKQQRKYENTVNEQNLAFQQAFEEQKKEIKSNQRSSLQTLGLFTAFLSFIVTSIGTFRVASNIQEYIIYSLTYTLAIALFAFLISDRNENKKTNNENGNPKIIVFVLTFLALLGFASSYFYKHSSNKKNEVSDTLNGLPTTIDNSSTSNSTVNLKDIILHYTNIQNNATKSK